MAFDFISILIEAIITSITLSLSVPYALVELTSTATTYILDDYIYVVGSDYGKVGVILKYDLNGNYIQSFISAKSAAESLGKITKTSKGASSHIADVCKGKRKTAYGFIWKYAEEK